MSRHMGDCAGDDYCGGSCRQTGIPATMAHERCNDCGAAHDEDHTPKCSQYRPGMLSRYELNSLKANLRYNSANLGDLGTFVRLEYVLTLIDDFVKRSEMNL